MRILGATDYYSGVQSYGGFDDPYIVLQLSKSSKAKIVNANDTPLSKMELHLTIADPDSKYYDHNKWTFKKQSFSFEGVTAYVAGELYQGIKVTPLNDIVQYYWDYDSFVIFLDSIKAIVKSWTWVHPLSQRVLCAKDWFDMAISQQEKDWLFENQITIAVTDTSFTNSYDYMIDSNVLQDMMFYRKMDAYAIYQEIFMWKASLRNQEKDLIELTDDVKIKKRGFDKWSFRKKAKDKK